MNYNLTVQETFNEACYLFDGGRLLLQSTRDRISILADVANILTFDNHLSVTQESSPVPERLKNSTPETLDEEGALERIQVKNAAYRFTP